MYKFSSIETYENLETSLEIKEIKGYIKTWIFSLTDNKCAKRVSFTVGEVL